MHFIKKRYNKQSSDKKSSNNKIEDNNPNYVSIKNNDKVTSTKSKKGVISENNKEDIDRNVFLRNNTSFTIKILNLKDLVECKKNLDEIMNIRTITGKQYNTIHRNLYLSKN